MPDRPLCVNIAGVFYPIGLHATTLGVVGAQAAWRLLLAACVRAIVQR